MPMVYIFPELEHDQEKRNRIIGWINESHSLRQDVEMYLLENYGRELKAIDDDLIEVEEIKMSDTQKSVNDALNAFLSSKSDGLHTTGD